MTRMTVIDRKDKKRFKARLIAEALVGIRLLLSFIVVYLGVAYQGTFPSEGLKVLLILNMIGWTTDFLDGPLARYSNLPAWYLGEREFIVDLFFAWANAVALSVMGVFPLGWLVGYFVIYLLVYWGIPMKLVSMLFAAPVEALPLFTAWVVTPLWALGYLIWVVVCFILKKTRVVQVLKEIT